MNPQQDKLKGNDDPTTIDKEDVVMKDTTEEAKADKSSLERKSGEASGVEIQKIEKFKESKIPTENTQERMEEKSSEPNTKIQRKTDKTEPKSLGNC